MFGLVNGFCDQKPERSEMNWPIVGFLIKNPPKMRSKSEIELATKNPTSSKCDKKFQIF